MNRTRLAAVAAVFGFVSVGVTSASTGLVPTPIGVGTNYHPSARNPVVAAGRRIDALPCTTSKARRVGAHLELFARGRAVIVPAGIGIPQSEPVVTGEMTRKTCSYPARTREPTGVIELLPDSAVTIGQLFDIWGQPLSRDRLGGFRARADEQVRAYVGGRPWRGDVRALRLQRHLQVVLELGAFVPPHSGYRFAHGL